MRVGIVSVRGKKSKKLNIYLKPEELAWVKLFSSHSNVELLSLKLFFPHVYTNLSRFLFSEET